MDRNEITRIAREAGFVGMDGDYGTLRRFANLVAAAEREKVAVWMIQRGYATGHGDTVEDLLAELEWQVRESEREACANIAHQWSKREDDVGGYIEAAIRARGQA